MLKLLVYIVVKGNYKASINHHMIPKLYTPNCYMDYLHYQKKFLGLIHYKIAGVDMVPLIISLAKVNRTAEQVGIWIVL